MYPFGTHIFSGKILDTTYIDPLWFRVSETERMLLRPETELNGTYVIEHPGWFSWMHRIYSSSRISQDLPDTGLLIHLSHSKQYAWFRETTIGPSIITLDQLYMLLS